MNKDIFLNASVEYYSLINFCKNLKEFNSRELEEIQFSLSSSSHSFREKNNKNPLPPYLKIPPVWTTWELCSPKLLSVAINENAPSSLLRN